MFLKRNMKTKCKPCVCTSKNHKQMGSLHVTFVFPPYRLLETKQELENECTKLQSVVCKLELAVADASNDAIHVTKVHQERHTSERCTVVYTAM